MKIHQITELNIDRSGLEYIDQLRPEFPVAVFHDEMDTHTNGYIRWHWHPQLEFVLAESDFEIGSSEEPVRLERGDAAFINAGQLHMFKGVNTPVKASGYALLFSPEFIASADSRIYDKYVRPLTENPRLSIVVFRKDSEESSGIIELLRDCVRIYTENAEGGELLLRNRLSELWLRLALSIQKFPLTESSRQNRQSQFRLKQMLSYIRQNYMNGITLEDIANAAMVSKSECLRCFRSRFEMTPIQYLIECRLEMSRHLLGSTDLSVKEIAAKCGFEDAGYFGRIFRKRCGVTPAVYRSTLSSSDEISI